MNDFEKWWDNEFKNVDEVYKKRFLNDWHLKIWNYQQHRIDTLEAENKELRRGLEFYADFCSWDSWDINQYKECIAEDDIDLEEHGGKLAREILAKYPKGGD